MTMRVTMTQTRMGETGTLLNSASTYTVSDAFGAYLVGQKYATDTDNVLNPALPVVKASRNLEATDLNQIIDVLAAYTLTIPPDKELGIAADWRGVFATLQVTSGAVTIAVAAGVNALQGTAQPPAQNVLQGMLHIGANTWKYM